MFTYTTCRACGDTLHTTCDEHGTYNTVHPLCEPVTTRLERLEWQWRDAVLADNPALESELYAQIEELDNRPPRLMDAAIRYAQWGWPVFPLKPRSKQPATRHGFQDATTDLARIGAWWVQHPDHNIGLPTGQRFDVIDVDAPDGSWEYHRLLTEEPEDLPDCHGQVATGSGGIHLYVKPTGKGNFARMEPGVDYRGDGGYVVAPPSTLGVRGRSWSWTVAPSPVITGVGNGDA